MFVQLINILDRPSSSGVQQQQHPIELLVVGVAFEQCVRKGFASLICRFSGDSESRDDDVECEGQVPDAVSDVGRDVDLRRHRGARSARGPHQEPAGRHCRDLRPRRRGESAAERLRGCTTF